MAATGIDGGFDGGNATGGGGGGDTTPPVISNIVPTPGVAPGTAGGFPADFSAARATAIQFDVTDITPGIAGVILIARFNDLLAASQPTYVVHNGSRFLPPFDIGSIRTGDALVGYHYSVLMNTGWPGGDNSIHFDIVAFDAAGNITGGLPT